MKFLIRKIILVGCIISPLAFADPAPVVSITPASPPADTSTDAAPATPVPVSPAMPLTLDQRVSMLERQLSAMNQIDLVNQVSQLEQQVQDLQGQVQVLSHTLQTVQTQTTSQYADLDQRLQKATTATPASTSTSTSTATTATTSGTPVTPKDTTDTKISEKDLYGAAYKNIREQKNADGIAGMKKYLDKYPDGKYASNAHYWLGQLYILKGDDKSIKDAVIEFNTVIKKYPDSKENKEASLKLGFAYLLQNKSIEAKAQFKKVIKEFPGTSAAQLAEARLAQLS